jgi:hypothetical protein
MIGHAQGNGRATTIAHRRRALTALLVTASAGLALAGFSASAQATAPHWFVVTRTAPSNLAPGQKGQVVAQIINLSDATVVGTENDPVTITDVLPPGLEATGAMTGWATKGSNESGKTGNSGTSPLTKCVAAPQPRCSFVGTVAPFIAIEAWAPVKAMQGVSPETKEENEVSVEGANAPPKVVRRPLKITASAQAPPFGIERFELLPEEEDGSIDLRAGSHPFQLTTSIQFNQALGKSAVNEQAEIAQKGFAEDYPAGTGLVRSVKTDLPPGLVADTRASTFPQCTGAAFATERNGHSNLCPANTAIGVAVVTFKEQIHFTRDTASSPVFNLVPEKGEPARLGFDFEGVPVILDTSIKTGGGYAAEVTVKNSSQAAELLSSVVTVWGVPGVQQHDSARGWECLAGGAYLEQVEHAPACPPAPAAAPPFLIMPTTCQATPLLSTLQVQSWAPGAKFLPEEGYPVVPTAPQQGCEKLPFQPSLVAQPDQHEASTPTGLNIEVNVPQNTTLSANGLAEADIRDTTVVLPEGMMANAGGADGLGVCSTGATEFAGSDSDSGAALHSELSKQLFGAGPIACPGSSKVGSVSIKTPLLENELKGNLYFGSQDTNPFASPLVFYLVADDPASGVRVKLAGEVILNKATGRPESIFRNAPPLPLQTLKLHVYDGQRAASTTPSHCGSNTTTATFVPSTSPAGQSKGAVQGSSRFDTTPNSDGQPCPSSGPLPFAPSLQAGAANSQAGGFSPFTLTIDRPDGDAAIRTISMKLPAGAAAVLASVTPCPEPQASQGDCGPESEVGHSIASSGLGKNPINIPGTVYLTGPYNGAPFGLSSVTEAKAGPFDLGKIVVRSSISVDENTAVATIDTAASQFFPLRSEAGEQTQFEGLPELIKGTPAQIKQLYVTVDRPTFEFNPTNCDPLSVAATIAGYEGTSASLNSPFQVSNCAALPFAPKLTATVQGQASKAGGTTFTVTVQAGGIGQANIRKVDLTLPEALPSRLTTIQKACLQATFESTAVPGASCAEGSVIGEGTVYTPVLKQPLHGNAYLVSHGGAAFPDVEFVLNGENGLRLVLDGKTDIKKGITYSRFETSPDAPFTKFVSVFPAGPHSALTANVPERENFNLCKHNLTIPTEMTGQNGAFISTTTKIQLLGCGGVKGVKLTKAQLLAKGLKACASKYHKKGQKAKRRSCEKQVRRKYGTRKASKSAKRHSQKH